MNADSVKPHLRSIANQPHYQNNFCNIISVRDDKQMNQVQFSVFMQIDDMNASNNYQKGMQNTMGIVFGGFLNDFRFTQTIKYSN